jgi:hypothetical protein
MQNFRNVTNIVLLLTWKLMKMKCYAIQKEIHCSERNDIYSIYQLDAMSWSSCEVPDTVFAAWIVVGIIWWRDGSRRCSNLILTASLLTVMPILMQHEAIVAGTCVRANGISTLVLTTSIVGCAFIHVYGKQ